MEAEIEFKPAFHVLGIMKRGKDGTTFIPPLWEEFFHEYHEKTWSLRKSDAGYGVMKNFDSQTKKFDYLAGFEVDPETRVPNGMTMWSIPEQTYVAIACTVPTIMKAVVFFQKQWAPSRGYQPAEGPEFEYYPEEYRNIETDTMYMYFPIKKA